MAVRPRTFRSAVNRFLRSAEWLSDDDAPAVTTLLQAARELDAAVKAGEGLPPALLAQFGLCYRSLLKQRPAGDGAAPHDEPDADLFAPPS